jgi:hypothetical protein
MSATANSIRALQEVVQDLSEKGLVKEEALRQISQATMSAYNASLQDNPFKDERVMTEDCVDMEIGGIPGDFVRHIPTGRIFTRDDDRKLEFKGIIMGDNFLPLTGEGVHIPARHQSAVCWLHGEDPNMKEVQDTLRQIEIREKETQRQLKELAEQSKKMKEQLKAAREGSLLAFQEVEIEDLEEERDRYKKLNEGLLKKLKEQKEENERGKIKWARCQNDITKDLFTAWEHMREDDMPIPTTTEETAKFCRWVSDQRDTLPECFRPVPFVWNGKEYLLIEPTNEILDKETGEVLGERYMCGSCDDVHVKWNDESDTEDEGPDSP